MIAQRRLRFVVDATLSDKQISIYCHWIKSWWDQGNV